TRGGVAMEFFGFSYHLATKTDYGEYLEDAADDRLMDDRQFIRVQFNYPLSNPTVRLLHREWGWTRRAFAEAVAVEYRKIYYEEETSRTPGEIGRRGLAINCPRTDG